MLFKDPSVDGDSFILGICVADFTTVGHIGRRNYTCKTSGGVVLARPIYRVCAKNIRQFWVKTYALPGGTKAFDLLFNYLWIARRISTDNRINRGTLSLRIHSDKGSMSNNLNPRGQFQRNSIMRKTNVFQMASLCSKRAHQSLITSLVSIL